MHAWIKTHTSQKNAMSIYEDYMNVARRCMSERTRRASRRHVQCQTSSRDGWKIIPSDNNHPVMLVVCIYYVQRCMATGWIVTREAGNSATDNTRTSHIRGLLVYILAANLRTTCPLKLFLVSFYAENLKICPHTTFIEPKLLIEIHEHLPISTIFDFRLFHWQKTSSSVEA